MDELTDGQTGGWMLIAITISLPNFLRGHKNSFVKKSELMIAANPLCIYSTSLYKAWSPSDGRFVILASK